MQNIMKKHNLFGQKTLHMYYTGQHKKFFFQKSLNVKMILEHIKVAENKYALSFFELALLFEI